MTFEENLLVGVIADTHGLLRATALSALAGCHRILHAGDIGKESVIEALAAIAPVSAIRGNIDSGAWADAYPETRTVELAGRHIYLVHNRRVLDLDPGAHGIDIVVCGHSHRPSAERIGGVLYLNPGSAGPRRFKLPISVARLRLSPGGVSEELIDLAP